MKRLLVKAGLVLITVLALPKPAQAQAVPEISPALKGMLAALPIAGLKDEVSKMIGALKKTTCANSTGCYSTQATLQVPNLGTVPVQLYFFTSGNEQQTFLLVLNRSLTMPTLLKANVQSLLNGTVLTDPIFSISTTDFDLNTANMPSDLQKVVRDSYFNVNTLSFSSGVQLAARANVGGLLQLGMQKLYVKSDQMTLRAGVVMPIPADLKDAAGSGVGLAQALKDSNTMKKAGADTLKPEAYIELQLGPNAAVQLISPPVNLTDATFFLDNELTFGYKGNATFRGINKPILMQFQTPLTAAGVMDFANFSFRMATPSSFTLEDAANVMVAMATQDPRLVKYGGGFIGGISTLVAPLLAVAKPLSVFQLNNPFPAAPYRLGDSTKPFPTDDKVFNIMLIGPLPVAEGGPLMHLAGNTKILGQTMGKMEVTTDIKGFHGSAEASLSLKMGPLGKVGIKMLAQTDVDKSGEVIRLKGNVLGRTLEVNLIGAMLTVDSPATCATPFEIKATADITPTLDLSQLLDLQAGVNVDPSKITGCLGQDLAKALTWVTTTGKNLGGYTASAANSALTKISNDAAAVAKETAAVAKDIARTAANISEAGNAIKSVGNAFKNLGKKKRHQGPDPLYAASVFDWDYYYDKYLFAPGIDLILHWKLYGLTQAYRGSLEFDATFYSARYPDVQQLCPGNLQCALEHWLNDGIDQGRQGSPDFSLADYMSRYPEVQKAANAANPNSPFTFALEDWLNTGKDAGRNGRPTWDTSRNQVPGPAIAGGGHGHPLWDDFSVCAHSKLQGFNVWVGSSINKVQFWYAGHGWAPEHGGSGGAFVQVVLPSDEYFDRIDYGAGGSLDRLTFFTNKGRQFGPYGGGSDTGSYTAWPGQGIGCMAGRNGSVIDQLVISSTGVR